MHFILLNDNVWDSIQIYFKVIVKGPIDNKSPLVQMMALHHTGNKSLSDPMMTQFTDACMHHVASMS